MFLEMQSLRLLVQVMTLNVVIFFFSKCHSVRLILSLFQAIMLVL